MRDDADKQPESFLHRHGPMLGGAATLAVVGLLGWHALARLGGTHAPEPPRIQEISVVQPPPPPPPPPKIDEPPPPEQAIEQPKPEPEPQAQDTAADEAPPGDELGLDAEGGAGSDGFGLRAKKGGRGLIGGGDRNRWYAGVVQRDLQSALSENDAVRGARYAVLVKLWLAGDGRVERFELSGWNGDQEVERALRAALAGLRLKDPPPADLPQPLKWRISAR